MIFYFTWNRKKSYCYLNNITYWLLQLKCYAHFDIWCIDSSESMQKYQQNLAGF